MTKNKEPLGQSVIPRELEYSINGKKHIAKWAYLCTFLFPTIINRPTFALKVQLLLIGLPLH